MPSHIDDIEFHGQPALALATANGAQAIVSLFGAQLLSWIPARGEERLYLSEHAVFDGGTPIRGGVPVCFPQFSDLGKLPRHGFVRERMWTPRERRCGDDYAIVTLGLTDDEGSHALWPPMFDVELTVAIDGERLDVELEVDNTGHAPFAFTAALHTYLRVREVEHARIEGLYGHDYRDAADGNRIKHESGEFVAIDRETDRVYHAVTRPLVLHDSGRRLAIRAEGFPDVVVWNPWEARCAALSDMPARGFREMLCIEAAVAHGKQSLDAGEAWCGRQTLIAA
jgi:glucose-6-phosphate 1-epimerase